MSAQPSRYSAFISYASQDRSKAEEICVSLEDRGFRCWIAPRDVRAGREYGDEIIHGIENARCLILVLSSSANASHFVRREVERAVSKNKPVFPVRIEQVMPSSALELFVSTSHWLDAWSGGMEEHMDRLARDLGGDDAGAARPLAASSARSAGAPWSVIGIAAIVVIVAVVIGIVMMMSNRRGNVVITPPPPATTQAVLQDETEQPPTSPPQTQPISPPPIAQQPPPTVRNEKQLLIEKCQTPEVRKLLEPFLAKGYWQPIGQPLDEVEQLPMSLSRLKASGALESGRKGLEKLLEIGNTNDPIPGINPGHPDRLRPHWHFPRNFDALSPDERVRLDHAQDLLNELGETLVELKMLSR